MIILGIDPGTAITGWAVIDGATSTPSAINFGCITSHAHSPLPQRLAHIYTELTALIERHHPTVIAVEQLFFSKNVKTALAVGHARGVVLLAAQQHGLAMFEYTPLQVKQNVTGYGKADKAQVQTMVTKMFRLKAVPKPDDVADALAIALCHHSMRKWQEIKAKIGGSYDL